MDLDNYIKAIFNSTSQQEFEVLAKCAFEYQYNNNSVYREYCNKIDICAKSVKSIEDIPFLPIEFFKTYKVITGNFEPDLIFKSSGTGNQQLSYHYVKDSELYKKSFINCFTFFFGDIKDYEILALLPSYLEQGNSSLIYMVNELIKLSANTHGGFYLYDYSELAEKINELEKRKSHYLLFGVSYALLDFADEFKFKMKYGKIIETGGMKGRRKEVTRMELHNSLISSFGLPQIFSEYGMTELLSQAYSMRNGVFYCPSSMKVLIRDTSDPLSTEYCGKGALNIIDLSNIHSCCFIASSDIGEVYPDSGFTVQGRFDDSQVRGCSLMVSV